MRADEVRALNTAELVKQLDEAYRELLNLRFRQAARKLVNQREIGRVRKKVARMKTILRERELAQVSGV